MPQDSLRSAVYRSLVHCDDPNGVVEGETIRKSKISSRKTEHRIKGHRAGKDLKSEKKLLSEEIREEEMHTSAPLQLLEVSRGAEKLNQTIDSWSKGKKTFNGQSKDIATDLLRGALDLQESLVMLFELQEASKNLAPMKEKSNHKSKRVDEEGVQRTDSGRFVRKIYEMGLQNSRLSIDGSSRNSVEELKKVIGESLYKQNLLSIPPSTEEKALILDQTKWDSASDIPSTSSSQSSSVTHSNNSEKAKGPSLIAKLMGLEELPSEPIQFTSKLSETEKKYNHQQRPMFDIEMPKARKPLIVEQKVDPARKTLKEIIDTMQLKGLLKSNRVEHKKRSHIADTSHYKERLRDEMPPIVIIKPRPPFLADRKKESIHFGQFSPEERPQYPLEKLRELEAREESSSKKTVLYHKVASRLEEMLRIVEGNEEEEPRVKTIMHVKKASLTPENGSIIPKTRIQCLKSTSRDPNSARSSVDRMNRRITKAKPQKESPARRSSTNSSQCKEGMKKINQSEIAESLPATTSISLSHQAKEDLDIEKIDVKEHSKEEHSSLCELTRKIDQHGKNNESAKESMPLLDLDMISDEANNKEINPRNLFLSSPSFLNCAQNLFDLNHLLFVQTKESS